MSGRLGGTRKRAAARPRPKMRFTTPLGRVLQGLLYALSPVSRESENSRRNWRARGSADNPLLRWRAHNLAGVLRPRAPRAHCTPETPPHFRCPARTTPENFGRRRFA